MRAPPTALITFLFCHGLGVNTVALPLLAVDHGHGATAVGVLVAVSAGGQIGVRMVVARWAHRLTERGLVLASAALLCLSSAVVLPAPEMWAFAAANLAQGVARGCFWVGVQAHVVRSVPEPRRALAWVDLAGGAGMVVGPATIGLAGGSVPAALAAGVAVTAVAALFTLRLTRLPLPPPEKATGFAGIVFRRTLRPSLLAAVSTGTWRGMLGSYIPVVLAAAGHSASAVGLLVGLGSATMIAGSMLVGVTPRARLGPLYVLGALASGASLAGIGIWPREPAVVVALLVGGGIGGGALQTLSTSLAAYAVAPAERGRVVADVGTYRAVALLASPLGIAALLPLLALGPAMALVGAFAAVPALSRPPPQSG
ncbi:MFS transporter [Actinomadura syzygii]|uniref:MFS transporter n=1 Tax=Actinomadura syzygii TaxID=1427538 RepID=UPI0016520E91|nr:MFS transporter [Actinomadura syzygii]